MQQHRSSSHTTYQHNTFVESSIVANFTASEFRVNLVKPAVFSNLLLQEMSKFSGNFELQHNMLNSLQYLDVNCNFCFLNSLEAFFIVAAAASLTPFTVSFCFVTVINGILLSLLPPQSLLYSLLLFSNSDRHMDVKDNKNWQVSQSTAKKVNKGARLLFTSLTLPVVSQR